MSLSNIDHAMRRCYVAAQDSPDPSTQNAAILISKEDYILGMTLAVNEFPPGVLYSPERWARPEKYNWIEHAERNCIYQASKWGYETGGATLASPWAACIECARAIICAGISRLITYSTNIENTSQSWLDSIAIANVMFKEAGVQVMYHDVKYGDLAPIRRNEQLYYP